MEGKNGTRLGVWHSVRLLPHRDLRVSGLGEALGRLELDRGAGRRARAWVAFSCA